MKVVRKRTARTIMMYIPCCRPMAMAIGYNHTIEISCDDFVISGSRFTSDPISFCPFCGKELEVIHYGTET